MKMFVLRLLPIATYIAIGLMLFGFVGDDDDYLTYWESFAMAEHGSIVNIAGAPVEQSSSLLHSLLLAALYRLTGASFPTLGLIVSIVSGALASLAAARLARMLDRRTEIPTLWVLVTAYPFAYWTFGGLETVLFAFFTTALVLFTVIAVRARRVSAINVVGIGASTTAFLLTRPEAPVIFSVSLFGCLAAAGIAHARAQDEMRERLKQVMLRLAILLAFGLLIAGVITIWRYITFGVPLPRPSAVKSAAVGNARYILRWSAYYVFVSNPGLLFLWILAGWQAIAQLRKFLRSNRLNRALVPTIFLAAFGGFVVCVGGDWMEMGRFFAHSAPLLSVLAVQAAFLILEGRFRRILLVLLVALNLFFVYWEGHRQSTGTPGLVPISFGTGSRIQHSWTDRINRVHLRDIPMIDCLEEIIPALQRSNPTRKTVILSGQAGKVAFYLGTRYFKRVQFLDMYGLTDSTFTRCDVTAQKMHLHPLYAFPPRLSFTKFFETREVAVATCGIPAPDIIFDIGVGEKLQNGVIPANGYRIVHQQDEKLLLLPMTRYFAGQPLGAACFVAVRADLISQLPLRYQSATALASN